jgi:hypothetical protein
MGSSLARVYTTAKTYPVEHFKHGLTNDKVIDMTGSSPEVESLGQPPTLRQET